MKDIIVGDYHNSETKRAIIREFIKDGTINLRFVYTSDYNQTKSLRKFIDIIFRELGIRGNWRSRFVLISDEMNNNAIEYGSLHTETNYMRFKAKKTAKGIMFNIEVEDTGHGSNHHSAVNMEKLRDEKLQKGFVHYTGTRGRGLFLIISNLVDSLYFKDSKKGGLIVGIKKELIYN